MQTQAETTSKFTVLLLMPDDLRQALECDLNRTEFQVFTAEDCRQAREILRSCPPVHAVLTGVTLSDGNWCSLLTELTQTNNRAAVLVCARHFDRALYKEVVQRGGYYLQVEPYHRHAIQLNIWAAVSAARRRQQLAVV
jgi:DNA-binding NtrC family response regulator